MQHELKTWPEYFEPVCSGVKRFEYRKNDRDFQVGDILWLREYDPATDKYSGRAIFVEVTYVLKECLSIAPGMYPPPGKFAIPLAVEVETGKGE